MDRRSLLAILLSTLVILAFNFFLQPKRPARPPSTNSSDTLRAANSTVGSATSSLGYLIGSAPAFTAADSSAARVSPFDVGFRPDLQAAATKIPLAIDGVEAIQLPGDPERKTMAQRKSAGIPLDDGNWKALMELANQQLVAIPAVK